MRAVAEGVVEVRVCDLPSRVQQSDDVLVGVGDIELASVAQQRHVQPCGLPDIGAGKRVVRQRVVLRDLLEAVVHEELVSGKRVALIDLLLEPAPHIVVSELQAGRPPRGGGEAVLAVPGVCPAAAGEHVPVCVVGRSLRCGCGDGVVP